MGYDNNLLFRVRIGTIATQYFLATSPLLRISLTIAGLLDSGKIDARCDEIQGYAPSFCHSTILPHDVCAVVRDREPIPLPARIQNTNVTADYKDSILNLTLPKSEEEKNKLVNKLVKVNLLGEEAAE